MENIDLKTYRIDDMNIRDLMNQTHMGNLNLKDLYLHLRYKFQFYTRNKTKREYLLNNLEEWERELILNGILSGEIIEKNLNRPYFNRDRGFYLNDKYYEDVFLTTMWVAISKIFEEKTTLSFINNNMRIGKFEENEKAPRVNDTSCINSEPDFIWVKNDGSRIMVEQKCSYVENFSIKIRKGQMKNFEEKYNDDIVILVKDESNLHKDLYYFYDYKKIKPFLKEKIYGGNVKYYVTKRMLEENNVYSDKFYVDTY